MAVITYGSNKIENQFKYNAEILDFKISEKLGITTIYSSGNEIGFVDKKNKEIEITSDLSSLEKAK